MSSVATVNPSQLMQNSTAESALGPASASSSKSADNASTNVPKDNSTFKDNASVLPASTSTKSANPNLSLNSSSIHSNSSPKPNSSPTTDTSFKTAGLELQKVWERCEGVGASRVGFRWMKELGYAIDRFDKATSSYISPSHTNANASPAPSSSPSASPTSSSPTTKIASSLPESFQPYLRIKEDAERYILPFLKAGDQNCDWCCKKWRAHARLLRAVPTPMIGEKVDNEKAKEKGKDEANKDEPGVESGDNKDKGANSTAISPTNPNPNPDPSQDPEPEYRYLPFAAAQLGSNTIFTPLDAYEDDDGDEDDGENGDGTSDSGEDGENGGRGDEEDENRSAAPDAPKDKDKGRGKINAKGKGNVNTNGSLSSSNSSPNTRRSLSKNQSQSQPTSPASSSAAAAAKKRKAGAEMPSIISPSSPKRARIGNSSGSIPASRAIRPGHGPVSSASVSAPASRTSVSFKAKSKPISAKLSAPFPSASTSTKTKIKGPVWKGGKLKKFTFTRAEKGPGTCTRCIKYSLTCVRDGPFGVKGACGNCRDKRRRCILAPAGTVVGAHGGGEVEETEREFRLKKKQSKKRLRVEVPTRTSSRRKSVLSYAVDVDNDEEDEEDVNYDDYEEDPMPSASAPASPMNGVFSVNVNGSPPLSRSSSLSSISSDGGETATDGEEDHENERRTEGEEDPVGDVEGSPSTRTRHALRRSSISTGTGTKSKTLGTGVSLSSAKSSKPKSKSGPQVFVFSSKCQRCIDANVPCIQSQPGWPCDTCSNVRKGCLFPKNPNDANDVDGVGEEEVDGEFADGLETVSGVGLRRTSSSGLGKRKAEDEQEKDGDEVVASTAKRQRISDPSNKAPDSASPGPSTHQTRSQKSQAQTPTCSRCRKLGLDCVEVEDGTCKPCRNRGGECTLTASKDSDEDVSDVRSDSELSELSELSVPERDIDVDERREEEEVEMDLDVDMEKDSDGGDREKTRPPSAVHDSTPPPPGPSKLKPKSQVKKPGPKKTSNPKRCQRCNQLDLECVPAVSIKSHTGICVNCREHRRKCSFSVGKARPKVDVPSDVSASVPATDVGDAPVESSSTQELDSSVSATAAS
ncbi:hypothetical protein VKT23_014211 [Stygiomarasmius scandens]|uniref:Zn(2)-C6 fungal-type domain-containing protein n=1 Tax=Marasmiellus scandens TaxID=2682957 RepID=A0ABR1J260_9AGAR